MNSRLKKFLVAVQSLAPTLGRIIGGSKGATIGTGIAVVADTVENAIEAKEAVQGKSTESYNTAQGDK